MEEISEIIDSLKCRKAPGKCTAFTLGFLNGKLASLQHLNESRASFGKKDTCHMAFTTLVLSPFTENWDLHCNCNNYGISVFDHPQQGLHPSHVGTHTKTLLCNSIKVELWLLSGRSREERSSRRV